MQFSVLWEGIHLSGDLCLFKATKSFIANCVLHILSFHSFALMLSSLSSLKMTAPVDCDALYTEWLPLVAQMVKNLPSMQETWVQSLSQEDRLENEWLPTPVFWSGEFRGQRSLVSNNSPWGSKESDMTEPLTLSHFILNK